MTLYLSHPVQFSADTSENVPSGQSLRVAGWLIAEHKKLACVYVEDMGHILIKDESPGRTCTIRRQPARERACIACGASRRRKRQICARTRWAGDAHIRDRSRCEPGGKNKYGSFRHDDGTNARGKGRK